MSLARIGSVLTYRLTDEDAGTVNAARNAAKNLSDREAREGKAVIIRYGNYVTAGEAVAMICTRTLDECIINGTLLLDGGDTLWVRSVREGDRHGEWRDLSDR